MTISTAHMRAGVNAAPSQTWYRILNRAEADTAEIYIYDEIGMWGISANEFVKELRDLKTPTIVLHLNSPGGEVFEGFAIYNALRNHKAEVTVYVDGLAASAASFIAMAGDRVVAEPIAQMMIHAAHGIGIGDAEDMTKLASMLNEMTDTIAGIYAERAGGTVSSWRDKMKAETWFNATEALKAGLVDEVAEAPVRARPRGIPENSWDLSIFTFAGRGGAPDPFAAVVNTAPAPVVEPVAPVAPPPVVEPPPTPALVAPPIPPAPVDAAPPIDQIGRAHV